MNRCLLAAFIAASLVVGAGEARAEVAFPAARARLSPPDGFMAMPTQQYVAMTSFQSPVQLYAYPLFGDSPEVAAREVAAMFAGAKTTPRRIGKRDGLAVTGIDNLFGIATHGAGFVALSPSGGGVLVLAFDPSGLDDEELALAEAVARSARFDKPKRGPAQKLSLGGQGRGWLLHVKTPGELGVRVHDAERLVLESLHPPRRIIVGSVPLDTSAERIQADLGETMASLYGGELLSTPRKIKRGACAPVSLTLEGQPQRGAVCARSLGHGRGAVVLGLTQPLYASQKLERDVEKLALGLSVEKERIDPRAVNARNALAGTHLFNHGGSASGGTSNSREEHWYFCPDGTYSWRWQSVISLGAFGGSTKSDRHNGRWWIEQVGNETQVVLERADNGKILRYAVRPEGAKMRIGGKVNWKEPTRCQ